MKVFFPLLTILLGATVFGAPAEDLITDLPGLETPVEFAQYSGYLNGTTGRQLHYWFVESQGNPLTDPLLLWLNGGPGCSSLLGFLEELGPFRVALDDSNTLVPNVYSWNTAASVIFLESPACVGFSYDENNNCETGDKEVADMNYLALQHFFTKFPEYQEHDFYVTGESYGGIYIPTLSTNIVQGNDNFPINFKGYAIGNGLINYETNDNSLLFYAHYHAILGQIEWENLVSTCCDSGLDTPASCNFSGNSSPECVVLVNDAFFKIYDAGLNPYNLYDDCPQTQATGEVRPSKFSFDVRNLFRKLRENKMSPEPYIAQPCDTDSVTRNYLNTRAVRRALHIPSSVQDWDVCSNIPYHSEYDSSTPFLSFLLSSGIRGLLYNGDVDMVCNFVGNTWEIATLGLNQTQPRRQWTVGNQVAGYVDKYELLDFVTVKGSGHEVPEYKPEQALRMITSFLNNEPY